MKIATRLIFLATAVYGATAATASAGFGQIVASFPAPAASPVALAWANGSVYCFCQTAPYLIWKVGPGNGTVLGSFKFAKAGADTAGLAYDGKYFWVGTRATDYIYRFEWGGAVVSSFKASWNFGEGLAWSGFHLWGTEKGTQWAHAYYQMRIDGRVVRSFSALYELYDLAWDGANFWAPEYDEVTKTYRVVGFEPVSGSVAGSFATPASEPRGAAYDGKYLWISTLANDGRLWKVDIGGAAVEPGSLGRVKALFK